MEKFNRLVHIRKLTRNGSIFTRQSSSSFNIEEVTKNYEQKVEFAAANYRKNGSLFRMVLPPPNVTGKLHLGHALTVAIEDAICRHQRNQGNKAEWIPGFDHAGIATQAAVERTLGRKAKDMTKEQLVEECHKWSDISSKEIRNQLTRMGASLDWNQSYYTLDEKFTKAVTKAFCILNNDGLIFRGKRIVHWCPSLASVLSSQEVNRIDVPSDGFVTIPGVDGKRNVKVGTMYHVKYDLVDGNGSIEVATTRPETVFADVAIAVHPDDSRFSQLIGKYVYSPVDRTVTIPIIADAAVIRDKGTGAVKITPSHDPLDYEIWQRNVKTIENDKDISCIDENGKMMNSWKELNGKDRFEARQIVSEKIATKSYQVEGAQVNVCSRTGDIIEPRLTRQWFLDCKEMYNESADAVRTGKIQVFPEYQSNRLMEWFENQEPWCLSRQLVWGHRIPAYRTDSSENWYVAENKESAESHFNNNSSPIIQCPDVLDTWFSSSLVPLVKNGWLEGAPIQNPSLNVMETGWDISGFWVARMIAMGLKLSNGAAPFGKVVLHGLIRDSEGRKMSKSLGNVIDPLDVLDGISLDKMIERTKKSALNDTEIASAIKDITTRFPNGIEKCGPDALRYALLKYDALSSDIPLDISNFAVEGLRFCNKLWNLAAYYQQLAEKCEVIKDCDSDHMVDEWIVARLATTASQVDSHMHNFSLHLALQTLYQFITTDICDTYLETTKKALWSDDFVRIRRARSTLQRVLQPTLVQLSAFMPFVCEHIYEKIFAREPGSILFDVVKPSLFIFLRNPELEESMKVMTAVISAARSVRSRLQLSQKIEYSGILEIDEATGLTHREMKQLAKDVTIIAGLHIERISTSDNNTDINQEYMACPVPGHNAKLRLKIDEESKAAFVESLRNQLEKVKQRQRQFEEKFESYEQIQANPSTKQSTLGKIQRKAENAKKVAQNASEEARRIEELIANQK